MAAQPEIQTSWNTREASSYWDMRLSLACAATDAHFQNRILQRDYTLALPVVARQPHPDINFAIYRAETQGYPQRRGSAFSA